MFIQSRVVSNRNETWFEMCVANYTLKVKIGLIIYGMTLVTFQIAMDCDYSPTDVVPIAVGVALAGLVVLVLVAYLVGRRRSRQRGYESV